MKIFHKQSRKILSLVLIMSLFTQTALFLMPEKAYAQSAGGQLNGNVHTGFGVGGIAATAVQCSGVMDKLAGALNKLLGIASQEVPVGDNTNNTKENCFDAIAHQIVVRIMDKITLATVDWINSGFDGSPLYLEDPEQFFTNVAAREINGFTKWFTASPEGYPFGTIVMTSILVGLQQQFQANVKFSLNQVLAHGTYDQYKFDFNVGGWAGYTAFLEPNNNVFGNSLLVNAELGRRINGTSNNVAKNFSKQLSESGGFLNQRKCVLSGTGDSNDYIAADAESGLHLDPATYQPIPTGGTMTGDIYLSLPQAVQAELDDLNSTDAQAELYNSFIQRSTCKQWKTLTPGSVVSNQLTTALNLGNNKLIQADEVSEDLGLIFDALILQLVNTGLNSLQSSDNGGTNDSNVLLAQVNGLQPGQVSNGNAPPPTVDSITGTGTVDNALLDVQTQYIQQALIAVPLLDEFIKKIRALDYCVPGPNPNWITVSQVNFEQALSSVVPFASSNPSPSAAENENENYYAAAISTLSGINVDHTPAIHNHNQFLAFMQNVFSKYRDRMTDTGTGYPLTAPPPATRVVLSNFIDDLPLYTDSYADLTEYLANINSYLPTLAGINNTLTQIQQTTGSIDPNNPQVQAQVSLFNSISSHFATESQLTLLIASISFFQAQIGTLNGHLDSCIQETVTQAYPHPNNRINYPTPIFPYPGLPSPNTEFLPGVDFGNGANDIDVDFQSIETLGTSNGLSIFESVLQGVY